MGILASIRKSIVGALTFAPKMKASSIGYDGASNSRRLQGWKASILGPNTLAMSNWQQLVMRSRDSIRNSAIASSAIQRFESNMIGTGIVPHFTHPAEAIRNRIQTAFDAWCKKADFAGQLSFYGLQALLARELFEAGECFVRFHVSEYAYFQLQMIESEQVPIFITMQQGPKPGTVIREGIIFDEATDRRIGYRIYKGQPYDSLVNPVAATQYLNLDVEEMIQVMKPLRAGALRGLPMMSAVLPLLYDIEGYSDAERLRKRLASMFAFFVTKPSIEDPILPTMNDGSTPAGVDLTALEPGTIQDLLPGENIVAPQVPETGDYQTFMYVELHKFAAAVGLTYEQLTGDMRGVNYSSARVALLEFRRQAEAFQKNVIVHQFCEPVLCRWMKEAFLAGELDLPDDFAKNPEVYTQCSWIADGWSWIDPVKEVQAAQMAVRSGFTSRTRVIRTLGDDPNQIDAEIASERKREDKLGIVTDTNSNKVLIGRETDATTKTPIDEDTESEDEAKGQE